MINATAQTVPAVPMTSPSTFPKPKKKFNLKYILGAIVLLLLVVGATAGFYLSQRPQDVRQQASVVDKSQGCTPTTKRCKSGSTTVTQLCSTNGTWIDFACDSGRVCQNGTCVIPTTCSSGQTRCKDGTNNVIQACSGGQWNDANCASGQICQNGQCILDPALCISGDKRCKTNISSETCSAGYWIETKCPSGYTCSNGVCNAPVVAECTSGQLQCLTTTTYKKCTNGAWTTNQTCASGTCGNTSTYANPCVSTNTGGVTTDFMCSDSDKTNIPVGGWIKYTCEKCTYTVEQGVGAYRCYENGVDVSLTEGKPSLNGACGQIDQLTTYKNYGTYCGLEEYTCDQARCQGTTTPTASPTSSPTASPTSSPPVGPMCISINMVDPVSGAALTTDPKVGDAVKFVCGQVAGANHYVFRTVDGLGNITNIAATGNTSETYTFAAAGKIFAQCQVCTTADASSCLAYESVANTSNYGIWRGSDKTGWRAGNWTNISYSVEQLSLATGKPVAGTAWIKNGRVYYHAIIDGKIFEGDSLTGWTPGTKWRDVTTNITSLNLAEGAITGAAAWVDANGLNYEFYKGGRVFRADERDWSKWTERTAYFSVIGSGELQDGTVWNDANGLNYEIIRGGQIWRSNAKVNPQWKNEAAFWTNTTQYFTDNSVGNGAITGSAAYENTVNGLTYDLYRF